LLFLFINAAICSSSCNHGAHEQCRAFICDRVWFVSRALGRREEGLRLRLSSGQQWSTLLIVLVGLVSEAANEREATEFDSASSKRPASPCAQDQGTKAPKSGARTQWVVGKELLQLCQHLLRCAPRRLCHSITRI